MAIYFNIDEAVIPTAIAVTLIIAFSQMTSCVEQKQMEATKETEAYLSSGCKKTTIVGSSGTHWVCKDGKTES